jgi:putative glutamine amidotransferase
MAPMIGISTYGADENGNLRLPRAYVDALRRAGGVPLLLPPGETRVKLLDARIDGLILTGGGDIDPKRYGGSCHQCVYLVDAERDETELALVQWAVDRQLPTLGICRGAQVINVALGGTLVEHVPDVVGEAVPHRSPQRKPCEHTITLRAPSRLASILGVSSLTAASWHHQAIREPGGGLDAVGQASDGIIEAVEMPAHRWLIGVQWHPELTADNDPIQQRLFCAFVDAAAGYR